jgi:hypothetical protein
VSVTDFGAKGDGVTDDRVAIQAAIDSLTAGTVYLPPTTGGYLISPTQNKKAFLTLKANVQLIGIGNPIIRVAKSSAPYDAILSTSTSCDNCVIQNLTIDSNIDENPISNRDEIYSHPRFEILLGSGRRIRVEHVTIENSSSLNSIISGVPVSDITVSHCIFSGNGDDPNHTAHDHSALYINANGAIIDGNIFTAVRRGAPSAITAIETHGSGIVVTGNVITDYSKGMNITGVAPSDSMGNVVSANTIRGALNGIDIWSNTYQKHSSGHGINGLSITGNTIIVNQNSYASSSWSMMATSGIAIDPGSDLPLANIVISSNTVIFDIESSIRLANSASLGIGWYSALGRMAENLLIINNIIDNAPVAGIKLTAALRGCKVTGNIIRNAGSSLDTAIAENYKTPIFIVGAPSMDVDIVDNQIIDGFEPSRMRTALFLATSKGTSSGLRVSNNSVSLLAENKASFAAHLQINDNNTTPLLAERWDRFVAPTRKVAVGSQVTDSSNGAVWKASSEEHILKQQ